MAGKNRLLLGEKTPAFTLQSSAQEHVSLQSFLGKPVLLAFLRNSE